MSPESNMDGVLQCGLSCPETGSACHHSCTLTSLLKPLLATKYPPKDCEAGGMEVT